MAFDVLSADGPDADRWDALVAALPPSARDIHLLPAYGRIYRKTYDFEPLLAVFETGDGFVLQPFVKRPLRDLPFLSGAPDRDRFFDIANAYGFGGPVSNLDAPDAARDLCDAFLVAFADWCRNQGVASEFTSLHPLLQDRQRAMLGGPVSPALQKEVVIVDLSGEDAPSAGGLRKGHRSSITAARRLGVTVEREATSPENLAIFADIYRQTMTRRDAAARWFLPDDYFSDTVALLGGDRTSLFFARIDGEVESACLLMHDFETAYYHYAGTTAQHPNSGAGNLLVWEVAQWAKQAGYSNLHLGGGVTSSPDDSLLRFKAGFSPIRAPLYTYFRIHDAETYGELSDRKREYERSTLGSEISSDFLPLYRR